MAVRWKALGTWLDQRRLLVWVLFAGILAMALRPAADWDMWWHLRSGAYIVEHRAIPLTDPFSHTRFGQPWVDQSWLAQIGLYGLYRLGGFGGLALGMAFVVLATFAVVFWDAPGHLYVRALAVLLAALASAVFWSVRPQMASVVGALVHRYRRRGGRALWAVPPLFAVWANLHAAWMAGLLLIGCGAVGEAAAVFLSRPGERARAHFRRAGALALAGLLSAAAISLNPQGPRMLLYPFQTVGMGVLRQFIQEWASSDFHRVQFHPFLWLWLATAWALALSPQEKDWGDLAAFALFSALALTAGRNVALFAVVAAPILAEHGTAALKPALGRFSEASGRGARLVAANWGIALLLAAAVAARAWTGPLDASVVAEEHGSRFPVQAAEAILRERPPGPLFNSYNWGGYLLWRLYPAYRVYVDGRTDLYGDEVLEEYLRVTRLEPEWEAILERRGIRLVVVERAEPLANRLREEPGWALLYGDEMASVFVRQGG
ncbi:MAG: hypothetical protein H5T59_00680 [Anaerolineae bacterium]|nr:hypothetical protein [Anaerolineae bacterium]